MSQPLNPDVFALDVIGREYRDQMGAHARYSREVERLEGSLERARAERDTARERADSLVETILKLSGGKPA